MAMSRRSLPGPKPTHRSRLANAFEQAADRNQLALIAYVTAGDPTLEFTEQLVLRLAEAGVDAIELGVPFSDPIADGPVIQRASQRALQGGTTLAGVLHLAARIRRQSQVPLVLFSYTNPVLQFGLEKFAREAAAAGVDGVLITDLTPEEAREFVGMVHRHGLDTVFLAAPTSTPARLREIARCSTGFVYLIARRGVTGVRADLPEEVRRVARRLRRYTRLPLAVGFGIAHRQQMVALTDMAEAAVVGSALVECCEQHQHGREALAAAARLVVELRGEPLREASPSV
jgi:tryptophan synthase alpha chain